MTVCFTGLRPQKLPWGFDESDTACCALKERLSLTVRQLIASGVDRFISGMAQGFDTYAAECVLKLRSYGENVLLECALPCPEQAEKWTRAARVRYEDILSCGTVTTISEGYTAYCMQKRNRYMVDKSDIIVACFDGRTHGGTEKTIEYAQRRGKKIIILSPVEEFYGDNKT